MTLVALLGETGSGAAPVGALSPLATLERPAKALRAPLRKRPR
jgi:hypothetical protein